ncbi:hypothetical protein KTO58_17290 [Chitinophaga pendula]|uniref:membrane or secreted protein n=1 Tax=Chitinophaga TaxID=79328 RepID=UPI000BAFBB8B|nr:MULTISPECIES: membrane or secreted protein [Chitinophaga]ASZ11544.1 membrane or secreted protein [Chitinophaga sp. MD30]UCJ05445.1 hypothetical protein KTO58_17290 [Chitinophaga pendula]
MKRPLLLVGIACLFIAVMLLTAIAATAQQLQGAWQLSTPGQVHQTVRIIADNYFVETAYDMTAKQFIRSHGGTIKATTDAIEERIEFNTDNKGTVGSTSNTTFSLDGSNLTIVRNGKQETWKRLDDGNAPLAGNWHITAREQDGKMSAIHTTGTRKTVKILSGTRFQWAAIDPGTQSFSGTGGGTYTFKDGKYTETIEFFSRDNSRVGMSLSFDGKVDGKNWHHFGLSSKGDKISEIWSRD